MAIPIDQPPKWRDCWSSTKNCSGGLNGWVVRIRMPTWIVRTILLNKAWDLKIANPADGLTKPPKPPSLWTNLVEAVGLVPWPKEEGSNWIRNNQQGFGYLSGSAICGIQEGEKWLIFGNFRQLSALSAMEVSLNFAFRAREYDIFSRASLQIFICHCCWEGATSEYSSYLSIINPLACLFIASLIPLLISPTTSWAVFCHCWNDSNG